MNRVIITFLFFIGIAVSSCTTSKSVVSQNADLSKYVFITIEQPKLIRNIRV